MKIIIIVALAIVIILAAEACLFISDKFPWNKKKEEKNGKR